MHIQNRHAIFNDNMGCVYEMKLGYMKWIWNNKKQFHMSHCMYFG